ncbi:hypothetical protein QA601_18470 [Chitinispirillales bacterium ANBcel5]|uniref:hypothetical protein n=1 Tax=Cellulosispirillum alkaliphilum TaxID=3039283 RepID=UPI002A518A01|nr:hypothetical protein [Chitinispirillales bacterium ANBcel5]
MLKRSMCMLVLSILSTLYAEPINPKPFSTVRGGVDGNGDSIQIFDIAISLFDTPDYSTRQDYEQVIRSMAAGIWEASNGAHYLGEVKIFQRGMQGAAADIIWEDVSRSYSTVSGISTKNGKIWVGNRETPGGG